MIWIKNLQRNTITFSIYFILVFIAVNGILDYINRVTIKQHEVLVQDVQQVQLTMQEISRSLNNADMGFRGFYIMPSDDLLIPFTDAQDTLPDQFRIIKNLLAKQGLDPQGIKPVEKAFYEYFELIDQLIEWRRAGDTTAVVNVLKVDPGRAVWFTYKDYRDALDVKEKAILAASQEKTDTIMFASTSVRVLLFVLGIPTLLIVLIRLKKERKRRLELFEELDQNNKQYLFNDQKKESDLLNEKLIISDMIENLRKATNIISNITKGNFDVEWEGLSEENKEVNKENLAGELLQMKEQMIRVAKEDKIRMWVTEGLSKFAELVRQHQDDVHVLSDKITSTVVKYIKANQASLFFVEKKENKETVLKLHGCYAYDRKKFLDKTVEIGQGLVGQTYLEKEITYLTSIPPQYVQITSGLGEATPCCLVVVPLKFNDQVEGILEIASFKTFEPYELEFLQRIGEIIASAILTLRSSTEMKHLMQSLQYQSEEMKSQEEEMRQNMEELQATQEEMARKAREYQEVISKQEIELRKMLEEKAGAA